MKKFFKVLELQFWVAVICSLAPGAAAQPTNDNFADRAVIPPVQPSVLTVISWGPGGPVSVSETNFNLLVSPIFGSLLNATYETDEPFVPGVSSGQTAWWTWTAPSNGIVELGPLFGSLPGGVSGPGENSFIPLLTAYTGDTLAGLSLVASNNYLACYEHAECGCHWRERNQITFHVTGGQAYQFCVDSAIITDASWQRVTNNLYQVILVNGPFRFDDPTWVPIYVTNVVATSYGYTSIQTTNVPVGGNVQLRLQFTPAPKNDAFEKRITLRGSRLQVSTSNAGATKQPGEPDHLGNPGGSSIWYSWTAPASGRVTLSTNEVPAYAPPSPGDGGGGVIITGPPFGPPTCGNEIDQDPPPAFYPVFAVYTGMAVNALAPANCLPVALDTIPNAVEFDAVRGQTYQIAIDGNRGTTGDIPLYLALTKPAVNDNFGRRIQLHGVDVGATGYNAGATHQTGEPVFGDSTGKTVWWSWRAPVSGTVFIDLSGSDYLFPVAVFTGSTLGKLRMIAVNSGGTAFPAVAGQTYQIAVSDSAGLTGAIQMNLQAPIIELVLSRTIRRPFNNALLHYTASAGQVVLLLRSDDGVDWQDLQTGVASRNAVEFLVNPAPTDNGPYYRAIVVDRRF